MNYNARVMRDEVARDVRAALAEDVGRGDLTAALIAADARACGLLICRDDDAVLCGAAWFEECFRQLDDGVEFRWFFGDGDRLPRDAEVVEVNGLARALLTAERTALNFLQTLSAAATTARRLRGIVDRINAGLKEGTGTVLADTRKTIPLLRFAQKYAARVGGAKNHRAGLHDEILLKENHIALMGGDAEVAAQRALATGIGADKVQVEVRSLAEMEAALAGGAVRILLDNFSPGELREAVLQNRGRAELEASGGADEDNLAALVATGVDRVSCGAITKHVRAVDFSFQVKKSSRQ